MTRGTALLELVLIAPLLTLMVLTGVRITGIVEVRLQVHQRARFLAWEMAGQSWKTQDHKGTVLKAARAKFSDSESFSLQSTAMPWRDVPLELNSSDLSAMAAGAVSAVQGGSTWMSSQWALNTGGWIHGVASAVFLDPIGSFALGFGPRTLSEKYGLLCDEWALKDGRDVLSTLEQSGLYPDGNSSELRLQIQRISFFGMGEDFRQPVVLNALSRIVAVPRPAFTGTFVVAHNYGVSVSNLAQCNDPTHPFPTGMNNLDAWDSLDEISGSNNDHLRCFDTMPFRDQQRYQASLPVQMFEARGLDEFGSSESTR